MASPRDTFSELLEKIRSNDKTLVNLNLAGPTFGVQNGLLDYCLPSFKVIKLCQALLENNVVTSLNLSRNGLNNISAQYIAEMLINDTRCHLTELNLSCNAIEDAGAYAISQALEENNTLEVLNLEENEIEKEGANDLAKSLAFNKKLKSLNLSYNPDLGLDAATKAAKEFGNSLAVNNHLVSLNLFMSSFLPESEELIKAGCEKSTSLESCKMDSEEWKRSKAKKVPGEVVQVQEEAKPEVNHNRYFFRKRKHNIISESHAPAKNLHRN